MEEGDFYKIDVDSTPRKSSYVTTTMESLAYQGITFKEACKTGNLPIVSYLWTLASNKNIDLMIPESEYGNNPYHYAALADTDEIVLYLYQQQVSMINNNIRSPLRNKNDISMFINCRNTYGETPILSAAINGNSSVIQALIDCGADILAKDNCNTTILSILAKYSNFWCLNYTYRKLTSIHGIPSFIFITYPTYSVIYLLGNEVTKQILNEPDTDGHTIVDWACDAGDVNIIEFVAKKGLNFYKYDNEKRSPLHFAVMSERVDATKFLIKCGLNPHNEDRNKISPYTIATRKNNSELIVAIETKMGKFYEKRTTINRALDDTASSKLKFSCVSVKKGIRFSNAIDRKNKSRSHIVLVHGTFVWFIYILTIFVPSYIWLFLVTVGGYVGYSYSNSMKKELLDEDVNSSDKNAYMKKVIVAPERLLGVWVGTMIAVMIYLFSCINVYSNHDSYDYNHHAKTFGYGSSINILGIGGVSSCYYDLKLFFITFVSWLGCIYIWIMLVWIRIDPGMIDTRESDFDAALESSYRNGGKEPDEIYCRTTLIKKPLRSKYCVMTGLVIARMDHYCVWINNAVGMANHKLFLLFLLSHLVTCILLICLIIRAFSREIVYEYGVVEELFSRYFFFTFILLLFLIITSALLLGLFVEQLINIAFNLTINEKLNAKRYSWIKVSDAGVITSEFDRGVMQNILEFMELGGYRIDYYTLHAIPSTITEVRVNSIARRTSDVASNLVKRVSKYVAGGGPSNNGDVLLDDIYSNSSADDLASSVNSYAQRPQKN